jgi:hypothetical protein
VKEAGEVSVRIRENGEFIEKKISLGDLSEFIRNL